MATLVKRGDRWRAQVRRLGQAPLSKTFASRGEAAAWARDVENKIDRGQSVEPGRKLTFSNVLSAYREHVSTKGMGRSKRRGVEPTNLAGSWRGPN